MPPAYAPSPNIPLRLRDAASFGYAQDKPLRFLNPYVTVTVGSWPHVLALAELTGDARLDAAIATASDFDPTNDETLHLFAGQSGGLVARTQRLPAGAGPEAIATGDFNQDGRQDVVLALAGEDALALYFQTLSSTLTSTLQLPRPGAPNAVAVGDFNGDLRDDIAAIAPLSGTIQIWLTEASQITPTAMATLAYPTGGYDALDVGDMDNDGDDDLVALRGAGYLTDAVVIYWQDAGHFPISSTLTPAHGGYLPHGLAVGDVNGDGLDDIVVTAGGNAPDAFLNIFLQQIGHRLTQINTDPIYTEIIRTQHPRQASASHLIPLITTSPITYAAHHLPSAVAIGDVNHDGRNDVVVTHDAWQTLSVYTQTVSGTLAAYATAALPYSDRYRPDALGLADLDGDAGLDVALVDRDHGLVILTNQRSAPQTRINTPIDVAPGPITLTGIVDRQALTVEVRLRGHTDWLTARRVDTTTWTLGLTLPSEERAWWIEARAVGDGQRATVRDLAQQSATKNYVQAPPDQVRVGVEDGPPRGAIIINDGAYATNQTTVTLTLPTYDVGGVERMRFTLDGQYFSNPITYTAVYTWSFPPGDGLKTLFVEFEDVDGHASELVSDTIILDTVPPASAMDALPKVSLGTTITSTWSGNDTGSGIRAYDVQIRNALSTTWGYLLQRTTATQTVVTLPADNAYCFRSRALDRAGNLEAWPPGDGDTCTSIAQSGVALSPAALTRSGNAGEPVIYNLTVTNTGSTTDTLTLDVDGNLWKTDRVPSSLSLPSMNSSPVIVTVTVPITVANGQQDVTILTAHATAASAQAVLTTTARVTRGVEIFPSTATAKGVPGNIVGYTFTVTNTGSATDTVAIQLQGHDWPTILNTERFTLTSLASTYVVVSVTIPSTATADMNDTVIVRAAATDASDSAVLTTIATKRYVYLPLVLRAD
jgi:hypothetical protein